MKRVSFSPTRVGLIMRNTLLEAARQKLFHFLLLLAVGLVAGAQYLRDFNFGASELKFIADFGLGALAFFGAVLTVAATSQLFFSEIEHRTVLTLLAKPVWRTEFLLGKYLGVIALIALFCGLLTGLLGGVLWMREAALMRAAPEAFAQGHAVDFAVLALAGALQWLKFCVLAALTLLVASFAQTQLFTVATGVFLLVICHLQYLAQDVYERAGGVAGQLVARAIGLMFPNFQVFNLVDPLGFTGGIPTGDLVRVVLYAGGYSAAAVGLAVFSFSRREV